MYCNPSSHNKGQLLNKIMSLFKDVDIKELDKLSEEISQYKTMKTNEDNTDKTKDISNSISKDDTRDNISINNATALKSEIYDDITDNSKESSPIYNNDMYLTPIDTKASMQNSSNVIFCSDTPEYDAKMLRALYSRLNNSHAQPHIHKILDKYEYIGSPIYDESGFDKETLYQIRDQVIDSLKLSDDYVEEIHLMDEVYHTWSAKNLLHSLVEALILTEIFTNRRPRYRRIKRNYIFDNGRYLGVRQ